MCYRLFRRWGEDRGRRDCFCFRELGWDWGVQVGLGGWAARALDGVASKFCFFASAYRTRWLLLRLLRFRACVFARFFFPFHNGFATMYDLTTSRTGRFLVNLGSEPYRSIHTRCFLLQAQRNSLQCCRLLAPHVNFENFESLKLENGGD